MSLSFLVSYYCLIVKKAVGKYILCVNVKVPYPGLFYITFSYFGFFFFFFLPVGLWILKSSNLIHYDVKNYPVRNLNVGLKEILVLEG